MIFFVVAFANCTSLNKKNLAKKEHNSTIFNYIQLNSS